MKLENDKYYTPDEVALRLTRLTINKIGKENITEVIEPSVGGGAFQRAWKEATGEDMDWCGDLYPAPGVDCEQADWIEKAGEMEYRPGRLVLGNPPFGYSGNLARAFYNAAVDVADYVAFILPSSQLNNTASYYKFDLIHSELLPGLTYTNEKGESRKVNCCFNIYRRPADGVTHKRRLYVFEGGDFERYVRGGNTPDFTPDVRLGKFGKGCVGRILAEGESLCSEIWIRFDRPEDEALFRSFDWRSWALSQNASQAGPASITNQRVLAKMMELGLPVRPKGAKSDPLF